MSNKDYPSSQAVNLLQKIKEFGKEGEDPGDFGRARGVAVSPNGDIVVADPSNKAVLVFSPDGQHKFNLKSPDGVPEGLLRTPHDVTVSSQGCIMVVDQTKYVKIFEAGDGKYLQSFATMKKYEADKKVGTCCLTIDNEGQILVGNYHKKLITIHDALDGTIQDKLTVEVEPYFLASNTKQQIIIGDLKSRKVSVVDHSGKEIFAINPMLEGAAWIPMGVACNAKDDIFVAVVKQDKSGKGTLDTGCILKYNNTGLFMACVAKDLYYPMSIVVTSTGHLVVANHNSIVTYATD